MQETRVTASQLNALVSEFPTARHEFVDSIPNDPESTVPATLYEYHQLIIFLNRKMAA